MSVHLYHVGDVVSLNFDSGQFFSKLNPFMIEAQLPHLGTKLQYRIKSDSETFRRVVAEDQINDYGAQPHTQSIIALGTAVPQTGLAAIKPSRSLNGKS